MIISIVIVVAAVAAVGIGIYIGSLGYTDSVRTGVSQPTDECTEACTQWQSRKAALCDAERDEADAKERLDLLKDIMLAVAAGLFAVAVALIAGGVAIAEFSAGTLAIVGLIALAAGVAVFGVLAFVTAILATAVVTAFVIWTQKQQATNDAESAETDARIILNNACTEDDIAACLANAPC